eukprot:scaffold5189_cov102-Cylindrotheca_fusiformis.AAC.1
MSGTIDKIVLGDNNNIIKAMMLDKMTTIFQFEVKTIGVFPALCKLVLAGRIVSSIKQLWDYIRKKVWLKTKCCKFGLWTKKYRVTLDTAKDDVFCVHTKDGIIRFSADKSGLYTFDPRQALKEKQSSHVATVQENREGFTDRQYKRALEARKFYH